MQIGPSKNGKPVLSRNQGNTYLQPGIIDRIKSMKLISQIFFVFVILFLIIGTIYIKASFIRFSDFKLFLQLSKQLIIPFILFLLLVKFLLPEINDLFKTESGFGPSFIKRTYFLLVFYLLTALLLQFVVDRYIGWFTTLGDLGANYTLIYANSITPLLIFLVRKSANDQVFKGVLYVNIILMLFVMFLEIPVGGYAFLFTRFLDILSGIILPVYIFAMLDIITPVDKIKQLFSRP
jgi:hypothetical protein